MPANSKPVKRPKSVAISEDNGQHRGKALYEVIAFLDIRGSGTSSESYLVEWKGYPKDQATWEKKAAIPRETRVTQLANYLQNVKLTGQVAGITAIWIEI